MPRIPLGSPYTSSSVIAGAQRSVNLYSEKNAQAAPVEITLYPRPGLTPLGAGSPVVGMGRALYVATNGDLYAVVNQTLSYIDPDWNWHAAGDLLAPSTKPVSIADNGQNALVVDGSLFGLNINLATRLATAIADPNFLGGTRI